MTNINLKIIGSANLAAVQGPFSQLQSQVQALNTQLASTIQLVNGVDAQGYAQMVQAGKQASTAFRNAAASSGMFEVQQMRVNSATDEYIKKLNKQKLSLRDIAKQSKVSQAAYREQLAMMEGMSVLSRSGATSSGRNLLDVAIPAEASKSLDTAGRRLAFLSAELKSASTQMVNWGKNTQWAGRQLAMGFTFPLAAAGAAAGVLAYQIDKELTRIAKVYDTTADSTSTALEDVMAVEKELGELREAGSATALKAAKEYGMAATDTLAVQAELAATGLKGQELQKATIETMRIARLGELDYQTATQSTIALQTIFRMNTDELTKSFNYMNSIENATSLSTQDFATAIPIAAGTVKEFGGDIKELGVLLTAMKSRGIEASQGANALKATMQRLGRPSKQVREEFKAITGADLTQLVDSSSNLTEIFTKIREVTKDLAPAQRRDVFAGVFGSYQVKQMMAMVDGMEDIEKGYGQVARAQDIAAQSSTQWADTAEREVERYRDSISGKWETSFNTFKAQLATFGEPFVVIATKVINAATKIMEIFSNLPGPIKVAIAAVLGIAAVAGPLLMLVGLMANLGGNAIKLGANIVQVATKMEILDKETWAARMATEALNSSFMSQTTAAQKLSAELKVLAASIEAARVAQMGGVNAVPGAAQAAAGTNQAAVQTRLNALAQKNQSIAMMIAEVETNITNLKQKQVGLWTSGASRDEILAAQERLKIEEQTLNVLRQQQAAAAGGTAAAAGQAAEMAAGANAAAEGEKNQRRWNAMTVVNGASMAAMAASMVTMMSTSNETAQQWANIALTASIVVPLVGDAAMGASKLASRLAEGAANSGGLLAALAGSSVKMGLIGAGVAAVGVGAYFVWKHFHDQKVEAEKLNAELAKATGEMSKQSDLLNTQLGIKQQANVAEPQPGLQTKELQMQLPLMLRVADLAEKMNDDDHFKGQAKLIRESTSEVVKRTAAAHVYRNVLESTNGSAKKAEEAVAALYTAAGEDAFKAIDMAKQLRSELEGISDLGNEMNRLDMQAAITGSGRGNGGVKDSFNDSPLEKALSGRLPWADDKNDKYIYDAAAKQGKMFSDNFWNSVRSADASKRAEITKQFSDNTADMWAKAFNSAKNNEEVANSMEDLGVKTATEYRLAMQAAMDYQSGKKSAADVKKTLQALGLATDMDSKEVMGALGFVGNDITDMMYTNGILDSKQGVAALDVQKAMTEELRKSLGYEDKSLTLNDLLNSARMKLATVTKDTAQETYNALVTEQKRLNQEVMREKLLAAGKKENSKYFKEQVANAGKLSIEQRKILQNQVLQELGLKDAEGVYFDINQAASEAGKETKDVANELKNLPTNIDININADQLPGIVKDGMAGVQQEMADDMTEAMDTRHEAAANALQAAQDAANDALQDSQDRANNALEDSQERATNAMERRHKREENAHKRHWEKMKDQAEKYWDARIKKAEDELEAEKKAEEQREKMFEAEIARIQKLNDMANNNIDFNMALSEGRFDEAAKLQNNAESDYIAGLYTQQSDQMSAASERRQDALSSRIDILQNKKDAYMQRLDKQEEAQKAALQRRQERESNALKKEQEMQSAALKRRQEMENRALKKRQEADSAALRRSQEMEKKSLQRRLDLFLAFTASNEKELRKHMKDVGISYNDFEKTVILPKGQKWGSYFGSRLKYHMRQSALQLRSDAVWEALGKGAADGILNSIGFANMAQFNHFVKTGEMKDFKSPKITGQKAASNKGNPNRPSGSGREMNETRHEGGLIGSGKGSRKGVAPTMKGLHHTERMVLAQKGEYMVNAKDAAANMNLLENINSGNNVMGGLGITGYVSALMSRMMVAGLSRGMQAGTDKVKQKHAAAAMSGMIGSAKAGVYGDASFSAEQMKNAQIIASVGKSMGMSARDIQIGIMTAITESMLRNVNYGDRDSLGLFQQRPSMGWGTPAQVTDPRYASRKFFEGLKGVGSRGRMDPWAAAQAVQRSAFADGSNYRKWWNESTAIFKALSAGAGAGFVMGPGGRFKPINRGVTSGLHDTGTPFPGLDFSAPVGTPLYAVGDGVISKSYDIRGYEPRRAAYGKGQDGYRSYGRVVYLRTDAGPEVLYAHLSQRSVHAGQRVRGGSIIGRSGDTGNSTGPHLHFGSRGTSPYSWLSGRSGGGSMGGFGLANLSGSNIPSLAKGGEIKWDNTIANLHKDERVLTADLNKKFEQGVNNFANGGGNTYNVNVIHHNPDASADEIAQKAVNKLKRAESRLPGGRSDG